eukprot:scaffold8732_cov39-Tisochrysis_lutea.AAC.4
MCCFERPGNRAPCIERAPPGELARRSLRSSLLVASLALRPFTSRERVAVIDESPGPTNSALRHCNLTSPSPAARVHGARHDRCSRGSWGCS